MDSSTVKQCVWNKGLGWPYNTALDPLVGLLKIIIKIIIGVSKKNNILDIDKFTLLTAVVFL